MNLEHKIVEELKTGQCSVERALLIVSGWKSEEEVAAYQGKLDLMQEYVERYNSAFENITPVKIAIALFAYLRGYKRDRYNGDFLLAKVIDNQLDGNKATVGNCLGLTSLYSVLGVRLGLDLAILEGKRFSDKSESHVLNVLIADDREIAVENTSPYGFNKKLDEFQSKNYVRKGLIDLVGGAYNSRGVAKASLSDFEGAISDYNQALEINPNSARAYNNRGNAKEKLRDIKGAISDYDQALGINPNYTYAYNNRGNAKRNLRDFEGAISDYNLALEINHNFAYAYNNKELTLKRIKERS